MNSKLMEPHFILTVIILLGGGGLLAFGHLTDQANGLIESLMTAWSAFWLGAQASQTAVSAAINAASKD